MARFMTRVELHHATYSDYETLHMAMEEEGFSRLIQHRDTIWFHLPTAEYYRTGDFTLKQIFASASQAAATTGKTFGIIVTEANNSMWDGLLPAS